MKACAKIVGPVGLGVRLLLVVLGNVVELAVHRIDIANIGQNERFKRGDRGVILYDKI